MRIYRSRSSAGTKKFAKKIALKFAGSARRKNAKSALVFALSGELGSGKTTFIQGFLRGLCIRKKTTSPTFIIFRRFRIGHRSSVISYKFENLYHADAYRIKNPRELAALRFKKILNDPKNIVLVEWAEKIKRILPRRSIWIRFHHGRKENERTIRIGA